jgi:hypothetical protein
MADHQGFNAVIFCVGSFVAARAAPCMAAARRAILGDTPPAISNIADCRPTAIGRPSAPYEGVARRRSASSLTTCYLSTVLRPKP